MLKREKEGIDKKLGRAAGGVADAAWEIKRELQVETNRPGYRTEGARKAIEAGATQTAKVLQTAKEEPGGWKKILFGEPKKQDVLEISAEAVDVSVSDVNLDISTEAVNAPVSDDLLDTSTTEAANVPPSQELGDVIWTAPVRRMSVRQCEGTFGLWSLCVVEKAKSVHRSLKTALALMDRLN